MTIKPQRFLLVIVSCLTFFGFGATPATADENDPPGRVARLSVVDGSVSFQPGGTNEWVAPPINRPLTSGDQLWSDRDGRAELELDGSSLRLSANTAVSLLNLSDTVTQIQLSSGTVLLRVRRLDENETYEVDTPNLAFSVLQPGLYRISVDGSGNSTAILVRSGQGEVSGGGVAYPVGENESSIFSGTDQLLETPLNYSPDQDAFDSWSAARDAHWDNSVSARYVSPDVVGYQDLDDHGTWSADPEYGNVWIPRGVEPGWAPYRTGHWSYIAPWGYTWVDDSSWGFAPFHYGRWVSRRGNWCWVPVPPRRRDALYVRPLYSPALVAWVGVGAGVAWFALGPREVYVPSYPVSRRYVRNINVSNTNVNVNVVNNVYNTTIVNKTVINNITYVNRTVPGAMVATSSRAFSSAQPVGRNIVRLDQGTVRSARVAAFAPAAVPTRQAVLGSGRAVDLKPPATVQERTVVARTAPPARPPSFERREEAIRNNGGRPLSSAQVRQISAASPAPAAVRLAPPAQRIAPHAAAPTQRFAPPNAPAAATPAQRTAPPTVAPTPPVPGARPAAGGNATRANDLPAQRTPPEQRPQQQQQAVQNAERARMQQQDQQRQQQQQAAQNAERARMQQQDQQRQQQQQAAQNAERARMQQQQDQQRQQQQQAAQNAERARMQQQQDQQRQQQQQAAQNAERARMQQQQDQQRQQQQQAAQNAERARVQQQQDQQRQQQQQAAQNAERARVQQQQQDQQRQQQQQAAQNAERARVQQQQEQQRQQQQQQQARQPDNPPPKNRQQDPNRKDKTPP